MPERASAKPACPTRILCIDVGGSKVKVLLNGGTEPRKAPSGTDLTPMRMMGIVRKLTRGWSYDAVSIGYPGRVGTNGPKDEAQNLGYGWVGFDYQSAFGCPVRIANDAAMQALGSYEGGRMLFLGLGTGVGSALVLDHSVLTLELGELPFGKGTLDEVLGRDALKRSGKKRWQKALLKMLPHLQKAFLADDLVLGGGNSKHLKTIPVGVRIGNNLNAFRGGFRMWEEAPWQFL